MELQFWEKKADLFVPGQPGSGKPCLFATDMVVCVFHLWSSLSPAERETAKLRLEDQTVLGAVEIGALAGRRDFPFG